MIFSSGKILQTNLKKPKIDAGSLISGESYLLGHTVQMVYGLRANMVKIDQMTRRMKHGEKERRARHDLVKLQMRIQRYVLMQGVLLHLGN